MVGLTQGPPLPVITFPVKQSRDSLAHGVLPMVGTFPYSELPVFTLPIQRGSVQDVSPHLPRRRCASHTQGT